MIPIRVILDDTRGEQRIARLRGRFARLSEVLEGPVRDLMTDFFEAQFETEGEAGGEPWADLKPATLAIKSRLGFADKGILERTGRLRGGLASGELLRYRITGRSKISFRVSDRVAATHQQGLAKMVPRPLLPDEMPKEFMDQLRNIVRGFLIEGSFPRAFGS